MSTETYKTKEITAYLLGNLSEAKTEVFDGLSFTDDDFANQLSVAEKDLVDSFVNGELGGETLEKFETNYLASPLRREKVEFAKALQNFAEKNLAETDILTKENSKENGAGFFSDFFATPKLSLQWGFALAALMFLLFGSWMFWENSRLRTEMSQTQINTNGIIKRKLELSEREKELQSELSKQQVNNSATEKELAEISAERKKLEEQLKTRRSQKQQIITQTQSPKEQKTNTKKIPSTEPNRPPKISIASFILSPSLRGSNQLQNIAIPSGTTSVKIRLELESDDFPNYHVTLQNPSDGQTLWLSGKIRSKTSGSNRSLNVRFPARLLKAQIYTLEVSGISVDGAAENISSYSFRVMR
jgi:hypothetical protein